MITLVYRNQEHSVTEIMYKKFERLLEVSVKGENLILP